MIKSATEFAIGLGAGVICEILPKGLRDPAEKLVDNASAASDVGTIGYYAGRIVTKGAKAICRFYIGI